MENIDTQAPHGWTWLAGVDDSGYGRLSVGGKWVAAHRISWLVFRGPIPAALQVLHTCDVRFCVCPSCLFLGTNADNVADRTRKNRIGRVAKLDTDTVRYIREQVARGIPQRQLAHQFGVEATTVHKIIHRKTWRHVP